MMTRKRIMCAIGVMSVVLFSMVSYGVWHMAHSPWSLSKSEVVKLVEQVHGPVELLKQKRTKDTLGLQDIFDYIFTDEHGVKFCVRVGVSGSRDDESNAIQDNWADAYLSSDEARDLIQSCGGIAHLETEQGDLFITCPTDPVKDTALREALSERVPTVPADMSVSYYMVSRYAFESTDGVQSDLFAYVQE